MMFDTPVVAHTPSARKFKMSDVRLADLHRRAERLYAQNRRTQDELSDQTVFERKHALASGSGDLETGHVSYAALAAAGGD
jgi:hypothetical protein